MCQAGTQSPYNTNCFYTGQSGPGGGCFVNCYWSAADISKNQTTGLVSGGPVILTGGRRAIAPPIDASYRYQADNGLRPSGVEITQYTGGVTEIVDVRKTTEDTGKCGCAPAKDGSCTCTANRMKMVGMFILGAALFVGIGYLITRYAD